jgi:aquaporin Z
MSEIASAAAPSGQLSAEHRSIAAEAIGTMVLILVGPGTAILASNSMGTIGVAFAFGFALMTMAYAIGHVSGCHINPAVTLGFWLNKKIETPLAIMYMAAQIIGAIVGALLIYIVSDGGDLDNTGVFAANGWGEKLGVPYGLEAVVIVEIIFTAILVFVVLSTISKGYPLGFGGLAVGFTLTMIHLATIPVDNTSVNPARSIATAIFSGSDALSQLWAFIVFPMIGGALGYGAHVLIHGGDTDSDETDDHTAD